MRRAAVLALLLGGCAVGLATPDGRAYGVALGQAEIRACRAEPPTEASCSYVRGGQLSPEGAKAIGPLSQLFAVLAGLL